MLVATFRAPRRIERDWRLDPVWFQRSRSAEFISLSNERQPWSVDEYENVESEWGGVLERLQTFGLESKTSRLKELHRLATRMVGGLPDDQRLEMEELELERKIFLALTLGAERSGPERELPSATLTRMLKGRSAGSTIEEIRRAWNGTTSSDIRDMHRSALEFYGDLYADGEYDTALLTTILERWVHADVAEQAAAVGNPLTEDEVLAALLQLPRYEAPGPDGIGTFFYRDLRAIVVPLLADLFDSFLELGSVPDRFRHGTILPIYEKGDPTDWANYRPITLLNTDYKIMMRALYDRMTPIVQKLVRPSQSGFIPGRDIVDNVVMVHEAVQVCRRDLVRPGLKSATV